jgi:site-specific recombinase XerD/ubiquitin
MPNATSDDVEALRERISDSDPDAEGIDPEDYADDRERLLEASKVMGRYRSEWGYNRHRSVLKRLIILSWGGTDDYGYTEDEMHDSSLSAALETKEAAGEIVEWIHDHYANEETNRDMRGALRTFGKVLTNEDPTDKEAAPPPSIDWVPATLPDNYDPVPNPANMIVEEEMKAMCDHRGTNARDAALIAVAWDAGPRSGELEALTVGDVNDHDLGRIIRVDGKTGERDVTVTHAVPYLSQWLNQHPGKDDPDAPLWSKLKKPEDISYRMYRNVFADAAERVGLDKPDDPTNFRKSSASDLASKGVSQAHLEKRYGWKRGSDAASRYIRVFGEDADRELARARNMDVDLEDDEPEGQTECIRCGELIDPDDDTCWRCDAIQDPVEAQKAMTTGGADVGNMIQQAVREELGDILGDELPVALGGHGPHEAPEEATEERAESLREKLGID